MITVNVMSQYNAMEAAKQLKCRTAIISINGKYAEDVDFEKSGNLVDVLHLHFEDYDVPDEDAMTEADADRIAAFLDKVMNSIDRLIVHCGFGTSRSVGTATAIVNSFRKDEGEMVRMMGENGNIYCYGLVKAALDKHFSGRKNKTGGMHWSKKCLKCKNGELCAHRI